MVVSWVRCDCWEVIGLGESPGARLAAVGVAKDRWKGDEMKLDGRQIPGDLDRLSSTRGFKSCSGMAGKFVAASFCDLGGAGVELML